MGLYVSVMHCLRFLGEKTGLMKHASADADDYPPPSLAKGPSIDMWNSNDPSKDTANTQRRLSGGAEHCNPPGH